MAIHELKAWPAPFAAVKSGEKTAEVRFNDRCFEVEDFIALREFDPASGGYTGEEMLLFVKHIQTGFGLPDGLVVLSFVRMR